MGKESRECYTCGAKYDYCTRCSKYASQPKWRWMWDTEECKDLYEAVSGYKMGVSGKEEIEDVINKYGIKDYSKYRDGIRSLLEELFNKSFVPNTFKKKNKKKDMDIDLKETEEVVQEVVEKKEFVEPVLEPTPEQTVEEILNGISEI